MNQTLNYAGPGTIKKLSLVRLGGALGIAACCIGLLIFLAACAGFNAAFNLALIPLVLSGPGMVISVLGTVCQKHDTMIEESQPMAAMFVNLMGLIGGILEVAVWLNWHLFPGGK